MIYLELFWTFFKIGLFSFGGGYGMLPLIKQEVLAKGWIDESLLYDFIGVSESTPGPLAVNMATFIGSDEGGFLGSVCATLGVVLPSFIIILLIVCVFKGFLKNKHVKNALNGIKPVVVGLIAATALSVIIANLGGYGDIFSGNFDYTAAILTVCFFALTILYKRFTKKSFPPILLIVLSAAVGILVYGII